MIVSANWLNYLDYYLSISYLHRMWTFLSYPFRISVLVESRTRRKFGPDPSESGYRAHYPDRRYPSVFHTRLASETWYPVWAVCDPIRNGGNRIYLQAWTLNESYIINETFNIDIWFCNKVLNPIPGGPPPPPKKKKKKKKNGTVDLVDFSGLCSDQQLSFFTLLDRTSFSHYNNTKIIKFGWELLSLWVKFTYGLSFSGFARFPEFRDTIND